MPGMTGYELLKKIKVGVVWLMWDFNLLCFKTISAFQYFIWRLDCCLCADIFVSLPILTGLDQVESNPGGDYVV